MNPCPNVAQSAFTRQNLDGGFHTWGSPIAGCLVRENPYLDLKWMIKGYPHFRKPPYGNNTRLKSPGVAVMRLRVATTRVCQVGFRKNPDKSRNQTTPLQASNKWNITNMVWICHPLPLFTFFHFHLSPLRPCEDYFHQPKIWGFP